MSRACRVPARPVARRKRRPPRPRRVGPRKPLLRALRRARWNSDCRLIASAHSQFGRLWSTTRCWGLGEVLKATPPENDLDNIESGQEIEILFRPSASPQEVLDDEPPRRYTCFRIGCRATIQMRPIRMTRMQLPRETKRSSHLAMQRPRPTAPLRPRPSPYCQGRSRAPRHAHEPGSGRCRH